jgi:hypothetical protein
MFGMNAVLTPNQIIVSASLPVGYMSDICLGFW